jgi:MoaA/NifB/PqqE/SkfB family radical SAM enzyme
MNIRERIRGIYRAPLIASRLMLRGRYDFVYDRMPVSLRGMPWAKRLNLARAGLNLLYRRTQPWSMPLHMQFELVNYCDLRCPVCPAGNREINRPLQTMEFSLFRAVMEEVGPNLLTASLWGWGESLLHPGLVDFLREAQKYKTTVFLSTNGQHLNRDEVIGAIAECPPTYLIVAVDGITDETNSRFRIGARLAPVLEGMRRLVEIKKRTRRALPVFHMRFIVMTHNEHELPHVEAFAASNGFELLSIRALSIIDSASGIAAHRQLIAENEEFRTGVSNGNAADHICMEPFWFPSMFADGTVVACAQDFNAQRPIGRIGAESGFRTIWESGAAAAIRRLIRDRSEALSFCRNCAAKQRAQTDTSIRAMWLKKASEGPFVIEG